MKDHPIILSTDMVKAILEDGKTQTRRILATTTKQWKGQQPLDILPMNTPDEWVGLMSRNPNKGLVFKCRYGQVGDRLYCREGFAYRDKPEGESLVVYRADQVLGHYQWRPSIHMPRWASRITLEITEVRVERVQEISRNDAISEGVLFMGGLIDSEPWCASVDDQEPMKYPQAAFGRLWDSYNAKRGYGWVTNPWVWVISFKVVKDGD